MRSVREINELFVLTLVFALASSYLYAGLQLDRAGEFVGLLYNQIILVLPTVYYVFSCKVAVKEMFRFRRLKMKTLFLLGLFAFAIMPLMQLINMVSLLFAKNVIGSKMDSIISERPVLLSVFLIGVVPAVLEECVYRGTFLSTYSKVSRKKAVVLSGLLFGLLHLNFNQFSYAFVMGIIFCILVEGTDSIFSSIFVHFLINSYNVVILYLQPYLQKNMESVDAATEITKSEIIKTLPFYTTWAVLFTFVAFVLFKYIIRSEGKFHKVSDILKDDELEVNEKEGLITFPLMIGIGICVLLMILSEIRM